MTAPVSPPLGRQVAVASFFMVALRFALRGIGFVSTLILVHLLRPDDFGLVGLATAVFSVFDALTELSMQMALIRLPVMERHHMDTAWTMNILRGAIIAALLAASAGTAADWMHDARVSPILLVLSAMSLIQGFENIGMAQFRRDIQFRRIFEYQLGAKLAAFCVTIAGAFLFRSYWALVAGIAVSRLFAVAFSYVIQPYRPRLSLAAFGEMFHFSRWFLATNLLTAIESYTATLLFGRIGGPAAVGLYQVSWQVGSLPTGEIAAPIREPVYAGYAKLLGNMPALRRHFVDSLALTLMLICPLSVGLGLTADLVWPLALGRQWAAAAELIRLCAFYALFDSIGHFTHGVFIVLNRQRRLVATYAPIVILRFGIAIAAGLHWGIIAAVWVLTVTAALSAVIWIGCVLPLIGLRLADLLRPIWRTVAGCAMMAAVLLAWLPLTASAMPLPVVAARLAAAVGLGGVTCTAAQFLLWRLSGRPDGPERVALRFLDGLRRRIGRVSLVRPRTGIP
jgi:O-antigen/teichoic acid export membrane protein